MGTANIKHVYRVEYPNTMYNMQGFKIVSSPTMVERVTVLREPHLRPNKTACSQTSNRQCDPDPRPIKLNCPGGQGHIPTPAPLKRISYITGNGK
jgi:hypothetical protein